MKYRPQAVVKVGGSLSKVGALPELCKEIGRLVEQHALLLVPGGGEFADLVRKYYRDYSLSETAAHQMAILAMDQYGLLLGERIPNHVFIRDAAHMSEQYPGRVPILLPSEWLFDLDPLPHSWSVTSDSIAAWIAGEFRAQKLVLLKDVDGLFKLDLAGSDRSGLITNMSVDELKTHSGGVDASLASILAGLSLETWVINGRRPGRLSDLLDGREVLGTCIRREVEQTSPTLPAGPGQR